MSFKVVLYIPYYEDKDKDRDAEIKECLRLNKKNALISHIVLVTDTDIDVDRSVSYVNLNRRPTYTDIFTLANAINPSGINIIANADIYFDRKSIQKIEEFISPQRCLALTRWDIVGKDKVFYNRGDSQDVWAFKGAITAKGDFQIGQPGCDNRIAYEIEKYGYEILNPSRTIRTYHLHQSGKRNYTRATQVPPPYKMLPPHHINHVNVEKVLHVALNAGEPQYGLRRMLSSFGEYKEFDWIKEEKKGIKHLRDSLIKISEEFNPDLTFVQIQRENVIDPYTASKLKGYVINWTGDVRHPLPQWYIDIGRHIDLTCFTNTTDVQIMTNLGVNAAYLQIGYNEEIFKKQGKKDSVPDIVFMGNHYKGHFPLSDFRYEMVMHLQNIYGNDFRVYGKGYEGEDLNGNKEGESMVYRSCKIAINCSHFDYGRYSSDRILRIMGSGAFCLTKWYPEIEKDYIDGIHLRVFHHYNELPELIDYYLKNEAERKIIAERGHYHALNNHRWGSRKKEMLQLMQVSKPRNTKYKSLHKPSKQPHDKTLAVLIPTLRDNRESFVYIANKITKQVVDLGLQKQIQILKNVDGGEMLVGEKRNLLINDAVENGFKYVLFVDDDDEVNENFIKLINNAINENPEVDCVTYNAHVTVNGANPRDYIFGIEHKEYKYVDGTYYRPPGHLCAIKTDIASKYQFGKQRRGSDVTWSMDMVKDNAIKTSVHIPETMYYYNRVIKTTKAEI